MCINSYENSNNNTIENNVIFNKISFICFRPHYACNNDNQPPRTTTSAQTLLGSGKYSTAAHLSMSHQLHIKNESPLCVFTISKREQNTTNTKTELRIQKATANTPRTKKNVANPTIVSAIASLRRAQVGHPVQCGVGDVHANRIGNK